MVQIVLVSVVAAVALYFSYRAVRALENNA